MSRHEWLKMLMQPLPNEGLLEGGVVLAGEEPVIAPAPARRPRELGTLRGTVFPLAPDFDAPLQDFEEYGA